MSTNTFFPCVRFFAGRSQSFVQCGEQWRRMTCQDEAKSRTGFDRESREPHLGVFILKRPNGLVQFGFDLRKLDLNLTPATIGGLEARWREGTVGFSKLLLRSVNRRVHFSASFAEFEIAPEHVDGWKLELESILSDPNSYEHV